MKWFLAAVLAIFLIAPVQSRADDRYPHLERQAQAEQPVKRGKNRRQPAVTPAPWGGGLVAEARRWIGATAAQMGVRRNLWCVAGLNVWLKNSGYSSTGTEHARSVLKYGSRTTARVGAIAVLSRGRNSGHVGVVTAINPDGSVQLISANHGNRVAEATYRGWRVIGYVNPS